MAPNTNHGERIIWQGTPRVLEVPLPLRFVSASLWVISAVALSFSVVTSRTLHHSPAPLLAFAAWAAVFAVVSGYAPKIWLAGARYVVTERRVVVERGPFRRSVERAAVSFARVKWHRHHPGVGDLELVRAVPTGALHRTLTLELPGLAEPARVWAIIRGAEDVAPVGHGVLEERLDRDEQVLWSARPGTSVGSWLPRSQHAWRLLGLGTFALAGLTLFAWRAVPALGRLVHAGLPVASAGFWGLVIGQTLTFLLLATYAGSFVYRAVFAGAQLAGDTAYVITDKRVLIRRGREELSLDRARIVDVIEAPGRGGLHDLFLVLDGPRARAVASSGAFGEGDRGPDLLPVLESLTDSASASRILSERAPLPRAA